MLHTYYSGSGDSIHYMDNIKHDPFQLNQDAPVHLEDAQAWLMENGFMLQPPGKRVLNPALDPCDVRGKKD